MSQLERLARPFPSKYVRAPAAGKFGEYVPHHVVTQALLAILGPFDLHVGEVFKGEDGRIEGCLVTIATVVDGIPVAVTEVGDCEQPGNWKTQGARMKDAISDGVKRCAARLGCGLHLWAGSDFFLYEQLKKEIAEGAGVVAEHAAADPTPSRNAGAKSEIRADEASSGPMPPAAPASSSPAPGTGRVGAAGPSSSSPPEGDGPATSRARRDRLKAKCVALQADGVSVADAREALKLPLVDSCDEDQLTKFEAMVEDLEAALTAPFEKVSS